MSEVIVRRLNLSKVERFAPPIGVRSSAKRRGLVNELAFFCFRYEMEQKKSAFGAVEYKRLELQARRRIARLDGLSLTAVVSLSRDELVEVKLLCKRTRLFFQKVVKSKKKLAVSPSFPGCGIVDRCEGDVLVESSLFELKSGDRQFRSIDFRQIFVYGALNHAGRAYEIDRIGLVNPRHGIYLWLPVDDVARAFAGLTASQLYDEILQYISSGAISK